MKRLIWIALGLGITTVVVVQVRNQLPAGFVDRVRAAMTQREAELRDELGLDT